METKDLKFDEPILKPYASDIWELVYDWTVVFRGEFYHVPAHEFTDGASVPRFLWRVCGHPLQVPRLYAALIHDYLYSGEDPEATRRDADDLYRDLQIALGVPKWKARLEWVFIRLFGRSHWEGVEA